MNVSVILGHPDTHSFNHAIASTVATQLEKNGYKVNFHDLYAEKFNPLLPASEIATDVPLPPDIKKHCDEIKSADGIVIVHPNWWGQPPAVLKGWIDRVIRPEVAYRFLEGDTGEGIPIGLLKARAAIIFNTANTPVDREQEVFGDPLQRLWENCIFDLCGVPTFFREMFTVVITSSHAERAGWLKKVEEIINRFFPNSFPPAEAD